MRNNILNKDKSDLSKIQRLEVIRYGHISQSTADRKTPIFQYGNLWLKVDELDPITGEKSRTDPWVDFY